MFTGETSEGQNVYMHPTVQRMYKAAKENLGIEGQSQLALAIGESAQTVNNWESRGVSQRGAIKAARELGCSAEWIMSGEGDMRGTPQATTTSSGLSSHAIELAALFDLLPMDRVKRATVFSAASQVIIDALQQR